MFNKLVARAKKNALLYLAHFTVFMGTSHSRRKTWKPSVQSSGADANRRKSQFYHTGSHVGLSHSLPGHGLWTEPWEMGGHSPDDQNTECILRRGWRN